MQMDMSYVVAVVITGLVVVFLGLVLLIAFITAIGAIFKKIDQNKAAANAAKAAEKPAEAPKAAVQQVVASSSDDDEVIAVISAAVAMMSAADGTSYRIKSVKAAAQNGSSRSAWAMAGLRETTKPF